MTTTRITNAQIQAELTETRSLLEQAIGLFQGQHATPTAVAEAVAETPVAPAVEPTPEPEAAPTASDMLLAYVAEQGLAFAKGGRTYQDQEILKAQVRVLKTGKPEVLPYKDAAGNTLGKRGVTHLAIGRTDDGKATFTQFVYTPAS